MYNIEYQIQFEENVFKCIIKDTKWVLGIESFKEIQISNKNKTTLKILIDDKVNAKMQKEKKMKISFSKKKDVDLAFNTNEELSTFLFKCRKFYWDLTKKAIPIYLK